MILLVVDNFDLIVILNQSATPPCILNTQIGLVSVVESECSIRRLIFISASAELSFVIDNLYFKIYPVLCNVGNGVFIVNFLPEQKFLNNSNSSEKFFSLVLVILVIELKNFDCSSLFLIPSPPDSSLQ